MTTQTHAQPKSANALASLRRSQLTLRVNRRQYDGMSEELKSDQCREVLNTIRRGLYESPNHASLRLDAEVLRTNLKDEGEIPSFQTFKKIIDAFNEVPTDDKNIRYLNDASLPMESGDEQQTSTSNPPSNGGQQSNDNADSSGATPKQAANSNDDSQVPTWFSNFDAVLPKGDDGKYEKIASERFVSEALQNYATKEDLKKVQKASSPLVGFRPVFSIVLFIVLFAIVYAVVVATMQNFVVALVPALVGGMAGTLIGFLLDLKRANKSVATNSN